MAVDLPPELLNQYLMSNSVMRDPESIVQRVLSLIFGRNILEQSNRSLTGPVGSFVPFKGFTPLQFAGQTANTIVPNSRGADWFRAVMTGRGQALHERGMGEMWSGKDFPTLVARMLESMRAGRPSGLRGVTPMDTSLRPDISLGALGPASREVTGDLILKLLSNYAPVGRW